MCIIEDLHLLVVPLRMLCTCLTFNSPKQEGRSFYVSLFLVGPSLFTYPWLHVFCIWSSFISHLCVILLDLRESFFSIHSCCMSWWRSRKIPDHSNWLRMFCVVRIVLRRLRQCWRIWSIRHMFPLESWPSSDWMGWDGWDDGFFSMFFDVASFATRDWKHLRESNPRILVLTPCTTWVEHTFLTKDWWGTSKWRCD